MKTNPEKRLAQIADKLDGIFISDMQQAEQSIAGMLIEDGFLVEEEKFTDEPQYELTTKARKLLGKKRQLS
jgi:hypothetical protein